MLRICQSRSSGLYVISRYPCSSTLPLHPALRRRFDLRRFPLLCRSSGRWPSCSTLLSVQNTKRFSTLVFFPHLNEKILLAFDFGLHCGEKVLDLLNVALGRILLHVLSQDGLRFVQFVTAAVNLTAQHFRVGDGGAC